MEWVSNPNAWLELIILSSLEIVLGIDNIIFLSILVGRLPSRHRDIGRILGIGFAMITRLLLLWSIAWVVALKEPFFYILGKGISGKGCILVGGGGFLLYKSIVEIRSMFKEIALVGVEQKPEKLWKVLLQISFVDIVFSLDSVITAVGIASDVEVMMISVILAVAIMLFCSKAIGGFIEKNPTIKMLALAFLILVGGFLFLEGFDISVPKGYLYFAMGLSLFVEILNIRLRAKLMNAREGERSVKTLSREG